MSQVQEQIDNENSYKYQLPLRSTRPEIPSQRYNLEFEAQRSKYPIENTIKITLTHQTKHF